MPASFFQYRYRFGLVWLPLDHTGIIVSVPVYGITFPEGSTSVFGCFRDLRVPFEYTSGKSDLRDLCARKINEIESNFINGDNMVGDVGDGGGARGLTNEILRIMFYPFPLFCVHTMYLGAVTYLWVHEYYSAWKPLTNEIDFFFACFCVSARIFRLSTAKKNSIIAHGNRSPMKSIRSCDIFFARMICVAHGYLLHCS